MCASHFLDWSPFWQWPRVHVFTVGNSCRCYRTSGTPETIHPSYQTTTHTRCMFPCALHSPDAHLTACDSTLRLAAQMAAVGAAVLIEIDELADQLWQSRAASLGGRLRTLCRRCRRDLGVTRRVALLQACWGGGLSVSAARAGDSYRLYRCSPVFPTSFRIH